MSIQDQWDQVYALIKKVALRNARKHSEWRKQQLNWLQKKRINTLRRYKSQPDALHQRLPIVEHQISIHQNEIIKNTALKSA